MSTQPVPTRTEIARLRAEVAELQAELTATRHELALLQSRRATRAGEALRQGRRSGAVKGAMAAVGEIRKPSTPPAKPEPTHEGPLLAGRLRAVRRLRDAGELEQAIDEARAIALDHPHDPDVLDLIVALELAAGSPARALAAAQRLARVDDSPRLRARRRRIAGTLRALDERFRPDPGRIGDSDRSGPVLVVVPDPPEPDADESLQLDRRRIEQYLDALSSASSVEVRTVQQSLPPHYPRTGPLDAVLTDAATSLALVVQQTAPSALVAVVTDVAPGPAIVGRALASAATIPLVVVRPCRGAETTERAVLGRATGERIAEAADGLVAASDDLDPAQAAAVTAELLAHITGPAGA